MENQINQLLFSLKAKEIVQTSNIFGGELECTTNPSDCTDNSTGDTNFDLEITTIEFDTCTVASGGSFDQTVLQHHFDWLKRARADWNQQHPNNQNPNPFCK